MEIDINDEEIKKNIMDRMRENKSLERIEDKFKFGVSLAIDEIKNNQAEDSIDYHPFKNLNENEQISLQLILQYLKKRGFRFTLSCLLDESNSQINENIQPTDIKDIIRDTNVQYKDNRNFPVEPPKIITKKEFNNFKCIMKIDEL